MFKFILIIIFTLLFVSKANSEVVNNIEVINNERISKETILIFSKIDCVITKPDNIKNISTPI